MAGQERMTSILALVPSVPKTLNILTVINFNLEPLRSLSLSTCVTQSSHFTPSDH